MESLQELAVQTHGEGFPILIVHGWMISGAVEAADFEPIFTNTTGYRRIYVDLPGMGATPAGNVQSLDDIYEAAKAFITKHLHPSPFLIAGTSCGAYLARALAYEFAESVQGLYLRVPLVEPDDEKRKLDSFQPVLEDRNLLNTYEGLAQEDLPVHTKEYLDKAQHKREEVFKSANEAADETALNPIRNDKATYRLNKPMHSAKEPFMYPALMVTGRQDNVVGYRDSWALMESYPRASFMAVDRGDHSFPVDEQDLLKALVLDWLRRVEETRTHMARKPQ